MLRYLLASTAVLAIAAPAAAERTISTAVTQPVSTSTAGTNGAPDSITITKDGSVKPTSGTAVTIDSSHSVSNAGAIAVGTGNGSIGILANGGLTGDIVNTGTIAVDEVYTATDTDNDGDLDGPFALGNLRFGIRVDGPHTGKLTQSGTIAVEGNDSTGIKLGGLLTGPFTHDGTTKIVGDRTVAIDTQAISGNVRLAGTVAAQGQGAIGARFGGDIGGALVVQGTITATGYRYTTVPTNPATLDADDLLQGGSALILEGNVAGGVVFAAAPKDNSSTDKDEDKDGIDDDKEGNAAVSSFGAAPAVVIGATDRAIALGPVAGTASGFGLIVEGGIGGTGLYTGVAGNGMVIGGRGGTVTIAGGIGISGNVAGTSVDAAATALRLGAGASTPLLQNAGSIQATSGNTAASTATALRIDAGASLPTLKNSGTIKATTGVNGTATAIVDASGGLTLIENSGTISATGAAADTGRAVAIDLSANTGGATVRQTVVAASVAAPAIVGEVRFGSGNDVFEVADGTVTGKVGFGGGNNTLKLSGDAVQSGAVVFGGGNDALTLDGSSRLSGTVDFGGGTDTLALTGTAQFSAALTNAANLAVNVQGGTLAIAAPVTIGSLNVGAGGTLRAVLSSDPAKGSLYTVTGAATFAKDATLSLAVADVHQAVGRYTILQAGSIDGLSGLVTKTDLLPFLFKASLATNAPANTIAVDVALKTAEELELNRSQAAAYGAIFAAIDNDEEVEGVYLGITDGDMFRAAVREMLPDHAGGTFEGVSLGSRTLARQIADPQSPVYAIGGIDLIFGTAVWSSEKDEGDTAAYQLSGLGFSAAAEVDTGFGALGVMVDWFYNNHDDGSDLFSVSSDTYEIGGYWRGKWGGLSTFARGSIGKAMFTGRHTLAGSYVDDGTTKTVTKTAEGSWDGTLTTLAAGASYEVRAGGFFFRPTASIEYTRLAEDGYTEKNGGDALNLTVDSRKSDELAANGGLAVGFDVLGRSGGGLFDTQGPDNRWFRLEGEGGWREIVGGELGETTAHFEDGTDFTLAPEENQAGWYARLRAVGGGPLFEMSGEAGAEQRHGETAFTLRGTLRLGI